MEGLWSLATLLPSLAVATRRLHDTGRSGWNQLWALTVIGIIPLVIWLAKPGTRAPNAYGADPLTPEANPDGEAGGY